jgi:hypothetical protein
MSLRSRILTTATVATYATAIAVTTYLVPWGLPVRPVAACTFDGGGTSAAGSVTRTSDGRTWLCTDDGDLVPWDLPVISGGVCSMQGVCAAYPYPLASR